MAHYGDLANLVCGSFFQKRLPVLDPFLFSQFNFGFLSSESPGDLHDPGFVRLKGFIRCARYGGFLIY